MADKTDIINIKYPKKKMHAIKNFKDLDIENQIDRLLDKNEESIKLYLSRYIFKSSISESIYQELNTIFENIRLNTSS